MRVESRSGADPNNVHFPVMIDAIDKLQAKFGYAPEDIFIWIDCLTPTA